MENSVVKKTKRQNTIEMRQKKEQELLLEKFREIHLIGVACSRAGISRMTYTRWVKNEEYTIKVEEARSIGREATNDLVESSTIKSAVGGSVPAQKLYLSHNHDTYRYRPDALYKGERNNLIDQLRATIKQFTGKYRKNEITKDNSEEPKLSTPEA